MRYLRCSLARAHGRASIQDEIYVQRLDSRFRGGNRSDVVHHHLCRTSMGPQHAPQVNFLLAIVLSVFLMPIQCL
jgi:hypothetical protein